MPTVRRRTAALLLDLIPVGILWFAFAFVATVATGITVGLPAAQDPAYDSLTARTGTVCGVAAFTLYFVIGWTRGGTLGMRRLGLRLGQATDDSTISLGQAGARLVATFGWLGVAAVPRVTDNRTLTSVTTLLMLGWVGSLLWTTARSPSRQGWHDRVAHTLVALVERPAKL